MFRFLRKVISKHAVPAADFRRVDILGCKQFLRSGNCELVFVSKDELGGGLLAV